MMRPTLETDPATAFSATGHTPALNTAELSRCQIGPIFGIGGDVDDRAPDILGRAPSAGAPICYCDTHDLAPAVATVARRRHRNCRARGILAVPAGLGVTPRHHVTPTGRGR